MLLKNPLVALVALSFSFHIAFAQTSPGTKPTTAGKDTGSGPTDLAKTREMMGKIFSSVAIVLPLSLSPKKFEDPTKKEAISKALKELAENAIGLENHGKHLDQSFSFMSRSLAFDSREILQRFEQGKFNQARYLVQHVTENCIACHTRLPGPDSPKADKFFATIDMQELTLPEKAKLQTALRQFDNGMETYETILLSNDFSADELGLSDTIVDYLLVAIRVKSDLMRAADTLDKFRKRGDLPLYLSHNVEQWGDSLRTVAKMKSSSKPALSQARTMIEAGKKLMLFPVDRQALVYNLVASSILHRYLESGRADSVSSAEAYFLLGTAESLTGRSFWVSPTSSYLEASVRLNPKSPFARKAYDLLEEALIFEYSGSAGVHLPEDVERKLIELRQLLNHKAEADAAGKKRPKKQR